MRYGGGGADDDVHAREKRDRRDARRACVKLDLPGPQLEQLDCANANLDHPGPQLRQLDCKLHRMFDACTWEPTPGYTPGVLTPHEAQIRTYMNCN